MATSPIDGLSTPHGVDRPSAVVPDRRTLAIGALVLQIVAIVGLGLALTLLKSTLNFSSATIPQVPKIGQQYKIFECSTRHQIGNAALYEAGTKDPLHPVVAPADVSVPLPPGCYIAEPIADPDHKVPTVTLNAPQTTRDDVATGALWLILFGLMATLVFPIRALAASFKSRSAYKSGDLIAARLHSERVRQQSAFGAGIAGAVLIVAFLVLLLGAADGGLRKPYLKFSLITAKFGLLKTAFLRNVWIFCWAEPLVLIWGLVVALARMAPGKAGRPIRAIARFYINLFRGVPAVIVIYILGFGLPKSGLPILSEMTDNKYAILALTLTYGAYVAEVYRSCIDSIHWSQTAASRSLGLSGPNTMRFVIVPQAVRRIIPPLLNDFIGLQKDTSLVGFVGVLEAFSQARLINSNQSNLSGLTAIAIMFYVITVPQAWLVDRMIERDNKRTKARG